MSMGGRALARAFLLGLLFVVASAGVASATPAPGDLDLSFGEHGYVAGDTFSTYGPTPMAVGPEGETVVLEPHVALGSSECQAFGACAVDLVLARFNRDGSRDPAFGAEAKLPVTQNMYQRSDVAVGLDGKPVVATLDKGTIVVARFGRDGLLDPSFGSGGIVRTPIEEASGTPPVVSVQDDGRVVVGAEASTAALSGALVLLRYTASGVLDPSFGDKGQVAVKIGTQSRPAGLLVNPAGGIDIGLSECCKGDGGSGPGVTFARFLAGGTPDPALAGKGDLFLARGQQTTVQSIAAAPGGKLYAVVEEEGRGSVVLRLTPGGSLDPAFGKGGEVALGHEIGVTGVVQISADSAGRVVGVSGMGAGVSAFRLRTNGVPDRTFGGGRAVPVGLQGNNISSSGFGLQPNGRIVVLVEYADGHGTKAVQLARLIGGESRSRCLGKRATIVGTREAEKIVGTPGRDVIAALGGRDTVRGLGGDDLICGGQGRDKLFGGAGRDLTRQ